MINTARGRGSAQNVDVEMMAEGRARLAAADESVTTAKGIVTVADAEILSANEALDDLEQKENQSFRDRFRAAFDSLKAVVTEKLSTYSIVQQALLKIVLHDTELYVTERSYRCATNATLARALEEAKQSGRPIVLVAHSMGTLAAFDLLNDRDNGNPLGDAALLYRISRFISLGTQLGVDSFIEPFAGFRPPFKVPNSIGGWVNLRGDNDYVSPRRVQGAFGFRVPFSEFLIPTIAGRPHDIEGYLLNRATIDAITYGWCRAFAPGAAPAACAGIQDVRAGAGGARVFQ
jgi:hypothetical protein